jgi:hypothetical protein
MMGAALVSCADGNATRPVAMDVHYAEHYTVCDWHFDSRHRVTRAVIQGSAPIRREAGSSQRQFDDVVSIARKASVRRHDIEHPESTPRQDPEHPYDPFYLISISAADGSAEIRTMPYSWGNPTPEQLALLKILDPRWAGP